MNIKSALLLAIPVMLAACTAGQSVDIGQGFTHSGFRAPGQSEGEGTRFCIHSTSERLFFSFEVEDATPALSGSFDSERTVDGEDRVEVFFSPDRSLRRGYYCAEIDAAGRVMDYRAKYYRRFDFDWNFSTLRADAMTTPWGYRVSASVSRAELEGLGIDLDRGFWLGAFRGDRLPDGEIEWYSMVPQDAGEPDFHVPGVLMECRATPRKERSGVVIYPDDVTSLGAGEWEKRIDLGGISTIGLHAATSNDPIDTLEAFVRSPEGREFLSMCSRKGVDVEYELHAIDYLLPRELFGPHPEYFRVDADGCRNPSYNMCFSSPEAVEAMRPRLEELLEWVKPTTHRYYFWADDKQNMFCRCPDCAALTPSEQILLYENRLLSMLREYDPEATLAHLAYQQTLDAPLSLRAADGIFLEYAPIKRDYALPLSEAQTKALRENLMAFPGHTQHILEYWLDESMACRWKKDRLVPLQMKREHYTRDIASYRALGAADFSCFATWLSGSYHALYGPADSLFALYRLPHCGDWEESD